MIGDTVFFQNPTKLAVNVNIQTKYPTDMKIETLIEELKEKGPLIACWENGERRDVMVVGAEKIKEHEFVFFSHIKETSREKDIREYEPLSEVFAIAHKHFQKCFIDLYPPHDSE